MENGEQQSVATDKPRPPPSQPPTKATSIPLRPSTSVGDLVEVLVPQLSTIGESSIRSPDHTKPQNDYVDGQTINDSAASSSAAAQFPEEFNTLDPDHPLLARVQEVLHQRLRDKHEKLQNLLKEKSDQVKETTSRRENIGVSLYQQQQQLARLQSILDSAQEQYENQRNVRENVEEAAKNMAGQHRDEVAKLRTRESQLETKKTELTKIRRTLQQFNAYREELESRISLTKRVTHKTEEVISKTEVDKRRQDFYIDQLTERQRMLREQIGLYEYQLETQQKESAVAHATLQDANTEMDAILFEKKQLLTQWRGSLLALQRRDDMLRALEAAIKKEQENMRTLAIDFNASKRALEAAREKRENLVNNLGHLESELTSLEKQMEILVDNKERTADAYLMYTKTLQQGEYELERSVNQKSKLLQALGQLHQTVHQASGGVQKVELEIVRELQTQSGFEKQGSGSKRDGAKLRMQIYEKQASITQLQNEISRTKVESLGVTETNEELQAQLNVFEEKISRQNATVENFEMEMRRQSDELSKKQSEMDTLNRKFNQLMAHHVAAVGAAQGEIGPLEATIHNLQKSISEQEKQSIELQQFWLKAQNDLVNVTKKIEEVREVISDQKMKRTILERKKTIIDSDFQREENDIKQLQRSVRKTESDMVKINVLLSKHTKVQQQLEENNLDLEMEFRGRLKDAELESLHLEQTIEQLREDKKRALVGLVDAERQIMLWEKKIQLAKETQSAIDPNVGATEMREMEQEIHRMKLRQEQLKKLQEKMILDMERAIYRHVDISDKVTRQRTGSNKFGASEIARQNARKQINDISRRLKLALNDLKDCDTNTIRLVDSQQQVTAQINETEKACKQLDSRQTELVNEVLSRLEKRYVNLNAITSLQSRVKRFMDVKGGKYTFAVKDAEMRESELEKQRARTKKIVEIAKDLRTDYGSIMTNAFRDVGLSGFLVQE